jgi:lipoprotein-anchoring transpeptidase ErfK/SrfK
MNRSRAALGSVLVLVCAVAGVLTAATLASGATRALLDTVTAATTTTDTTTTTATDTTTTDTTTTPSVIAAAVTIGGVPVGGLTPDEASAAVEDAFAAPILVSAAGSFQLEVTPGRVGARANITSAVAAALTAAPGTAVPLPVAVSSTRVRKLVAQIGKRYDRKPIDSVVVLRHLRPWVSPGRPGRIMKRLAARQAILVDLRQNLRTPVQLKGARIRQHVTRKNFGPVIVIRRDTHKLTLYHGMRYARRLGVATGQAQYPTPLGRFTIVVMWRNPWWYPPNAPWAKGEQPVPPGPSNPLGTRWMGLSAPGVGIHGTPHPESIGYSLSHGCIRMRIPDAEWLFQHVRVGATVFIVAA